MAPSKPMPLHKPAKRHEGGFTLVEVLVALAVTGLVLASLMQAYASGLRTLNGADYRQTAALIAASLLDESATIELKPGQESGKIMGYAWEREVAEVTPEGWFSRAETDWQPFSVIITVTKDGRPPVRLETLRLGVAR